MIRCNYGADSIVWIEEGDRLYVSLIRLSRERTACFRDFLLRLRLNRVLILRPEIFEVLFVSSPIDIARSER
jgi:hypothetical protein